MSRRVLVGCMFFAWSALAVPSLAKPPAPRAPSGEAPPPKSAAVSSEDTLSSDDTSTAVTSPRVPFYIPSPNELFARPQTPLRSSLVASASMDHHYLGSPVSGFATEVRAHFGWPAISFDAGAVLSGGRTLFGGGFNVGRFAGIPLFGTGKGNEIKLLLPNFDARFYMSSVGLWGAVVGTGLSGLRYCSCAADGGPSIPLKIEIRLPTITTWYPLKKYYDGGTAFGFGIDAGIYF